MSKKNPWEAIYRRGSSTELGWYQADPKVSLRLIHESGIRTSQRIIDVGGGASLLVDNLIRLGFEDLTVLDLSQAALTESQRRLGRAADGVSWIAQDVTTFRSAKTFDLWHDRAALHFLTRRHDRERYRETIRQALNPGGTAIIGTFALGGRRRCAGLWVRRYGEADIRRLLGSEFHLLSSIREVHLTPSGVEQPYSYFVVKREKAA